MSREGGQGHVQPGCGLPCPQAGRCIFPTQASGYLVCFFSFQIFPFFFWGVRAVFILFSKISTCLIHFLLLTLKAFNAVNFTSADSFDCVLFFIIF